MKGRIIAKGRPASAGVAKGIVKVVTKISQLDKVEEGDILCVLNSNPTWTIGMLKSKALISEIGGVVCHAAVVAREMGIPCVVAIPNITKILKDGQIIKVDGSKGIIYGY